MPGDLQKRMFEELASKSVLHTAVKHAYDYLDGMSERRPFPTSSEIEGLELLDQPMPKQSGNSLAIIEEMHAKASPACVNAIGGRYFGFVTGGVLPVTLAARWLADTWDQNAPLFLTSPVAAKFEEVCESWLRDLFKLPADTVAGFVSGSSMGIYCGLAAARYRVLQNRGWDINAKGLNGAPPVKVIAGRHAHATVIKAVALLGLGVDNIEWAEVDAHGRVTAENFPSIDDATIIILQAGDVNSGAFDDFQPICSTAEKAGAWVHVDGAFGLWAAAVPRLEHLTKGLEKAQSWSVDAHKTLNTPYDSGIVLCKDKIAINKALHAAGSYLVPSNNRDGMFYTPELSRRARAVELWAALKYLGREGIGDLVYGLHERALQFADGLRAAGIKIINEVVFNQVIVAYDSDTATLAALNHIQQSGECWVGGAKWLGRDVIRISVCSWATTQADIERSVSAFIAARDAASG